MQRNNIENNKDYVIIIIVIVFRLFAQNLHNIMQFKL